ncbi:MAG: hypothetical protein GY866_00105 [Proteobacteria bacterium]|nr:hypothetical protein [Pseudomonadota bacterium]
MNYERISVVTEKQSRAAEATGHHPWSFGIHQVKESAVYGVVVPGTDGRAGMASLVAATMKRIKARLK